MSTDKKKKKTVPKRVLCVPKGILRINVLKLLSKEPMSGSELAEEITRKTAWTPSPGSIYPLLKRLGKQKIIIRYPAEESADMKRFVLTDKGREFLKQHQERKDLRRRKIKSTIRLWLSMSDFNPQLYEKSVALFDELLNLNFLLGNEKKQDLIDKADKVLETVTLRIRDLTT
jgi:DNA-binding PadR family transcriptional regulator